MLNIDPRLTPGTAAHTQKLEEAITAGERFWRDEASHDLEDGKPLRWNLPFGTLELEQIQKGYVAAMGRATAQGMTPFEAISLLFALVSKYPETLRGE